MGRNTGDAGDGGLDGKGSRLLIDNRVRKGPFWHLSQEAGAWCYQVYNKIYHPRAYLRPDQGGLMEEYKYLTEHVTMWNVAVERQIQVKGPDATKFVDYVITRRAELCGVEKCKYVILCNSAAKGSSSAFANVRKASSVFPNHSNAVHPPAQVSSAWF